MDGQSANTPASDSSQGSTRLTKQELEVEALRLKIQLQTLIQRGQGTSGNGSRREKLGRHADDLRAVLAPMPQLDDLIPAWFKSAENMIRACEIPNDIAGPIIMPFLNEKTRAFVANQSVDTVMSFEEIRELVLAELRLTAEEYKRRFYTCRKDAESWGQFVTKLDVTLGYYLQSRKVKTLEYVRALMVADRAKQIMPDKMREYILQQETDKWLKPKELAQLAEQYEDSRRGRRQGAAEEPKKYEEKPREPRNQGNRSKDEHREPPKCYGCGKFGHVQ
ncbi:hypothetical protein V5799_029603 [Amblyomma americanum]|uniref:Uncharacterized protein n=1 Tax=Amblyomma americanum TaxID=6943 RepID=A0AAQ4D126_AMBAM